MNRRHGSMIIALIYALLAGTGISLGYMISRYGEIRLSDVRVYAVFAAAVAVAYTVLKLYLDRGAAAGRKLRERMKRPPYFVTAIIILVCWIPVFLAEFPGFFVYDAVDEYVSVATRQFSVHHPLLHTVLLGGAVRAGEVIFGNANAGIAVYIGIQMVLLSALFAWIIHSGDGFYLSGVLWYGLFPTVVMFALCSVKDTMFAAAMTVCLGLTPDILTSFTSEDPDGGTPEKRRKTVFWGLSLTLMMLTRHNGVYAVILYAIAMTAYVFGRAKGSAKRRLVPVLCFVCVFAGYALVNTGLKTVTDAASDEHQEMLTVPIQQLARTWSVYKDEMSEDELDTLYEILPEEVLVHYTPQLADPVKSGFVNPAYEADKGRYRELWLELFMRHPLSCVNAWLNTCYGYFYPFTVVNVYEGHEVYTFTYRDSSYFGYEVEYPGSRHSLIPVIDRFYRWLSLDDDIQRIPVLSLPFSMGALLWAYLFGTAVFIYRRDMKHLVTFLLPEAVILTLLLGPTFLPRYTVFLWFGLPYLIRTVFAAPAEGDINGN